MVALITGASSGIGWQMAQQLAQMGHDLILVARRKDRLEKLAAALPVKTTVIPLDLSQPDAGNTLYTLVQDRQVDMLINNAGFGAFGLFDEIDPARDEQMLAVNVTALHQLTKRFYTRFKQQGGGYILNVASIAGFMAGPLLAQYYASKAYVLRLSQALHEEARRTAPGVHVSVLCPGPVHTEFDAVAGVRFSLSGMSAEKVARIGIKGMLRGKRVILPGLTVKALRFASRFVPDRMLLRICWHMQKRKHG